MRGRERNSSARRTRSATCRERTSDGSLGATAGPVRAQLGHVMSWRTGPGISIIVPCIGAHEPGRVEGVAGAEWLAVAPSPTSTYLYDPGQGVLSVEIVDALIERARGARS